MNITKSRCCVYGLEYHIVWCSKYRKNILVPNVEKRVFELLNNYATNNDFKILSMNGDLDHIHKK